jgi:hypothetical protein
VVRADIRLTDVLFILFSLLRVVPASATISPDAWRRHLPTTLDGLRPRVGCEAEAGCSRKKWAGSILLGAIIACIAFRSAVRGLPEDHAVAGLHLNPPVTGPTEHHLGGRHSAGLRRCPRIHRPHVRSGRPQTPWGSSSSTARPVRW